MSNMLDNNKILFERNKKIRLGQVNKNKFGTPMQIIKYKDANHIIIKFEDEHGFEKETEYKCFKKGEISNPYDRTIYGIGYLGIGRYISHTKMYDIWCKMIQRCYTNKHKYPTYSDCTVCDEWHNFQNFAKWYCENYYEVPNQKMCVDKDILHKGNKVYSPDNCMIVPNNINALFTKRQNCRGNLPIGVCYNKKYFIAYCNNGKGKSVTLGYYNNKNDAFQSYKLYKENLIKTIAEKFKSVIPNELYISLLAYEVSIND